LPQVETLRHLPYLPDALPSQELDLYLPAAAQAPFPTLLMLRGGGDDKADLADLAMRFARLGYAVASANYRDTMNVPYPAAVEDAYCALAWLHANAGTYHLDTQHIYALGHSSGGTLAAMLGVVDEPGLFQQNCPHPPPATRVQGVITFTGLFDYPSAATASKNLRTYLNTYLGAEWSKDSERWAQASPITWIDGAEPPFLLVHGAADRNIPPGQSQAFAKALQAAGVPVELLLVPNSDHYKILRHEDSLLAVESFLAGLLAR
jgi:acetyl esterase/lipase